MRRLLTGLLALPLLLGVTALAAAAWTRSAEPARTGRVVLPGLVAPVQVEWTERAVPHIHAASLEDAVRAQGFLHARDRLWQMELVRRVVAGRLAEIMGEEALPTDRFLRRLGFRDQVRRDVERLDPSTRSMLQAYADGVNAAIDGWPGALPPEFLILGFEPEPWTIEHSVGVAKMLSLTLGAYEESVAVARALRRLPEERVRWLFPEFPEWGATILGAGLPEPPTTPALAARLVDRYSVATASNSWVVDGRWTASGRPILANDMHLQLQAPSLWYLVALHAPATRGRPGLSVTGVSIAGAPLVVVGRNRAIAWGMTNAYVDDVDLFVELVDPADPARYLAPGGPRPFEVVAETIRVKGREAPEVERVRRTRHGPVLPPADGASGDTLLAVQWTAFAPNDAFQGLLRLNLAAGWDDFLEAVDGLDDPHQNVVYADTAGHIGYVMGGTVPVRGDRRPAPVVPRPGWTGEWDWQGALPFDEHPRALDPPTGFVVTANNRQVAGPLADLISRTWNQPFRAMRIAEMIRGGRPPYDSDAVLGMQMDLLDLYAERYVDRTIEAAEAAGLDHVAERLRDWDRRAAPDSRGATLFYTWNAIVRRALARDLYRGDPAYFPYASAAAVLERRAVPWAADPEGAYRRLAVDAARAAADLAGDRPWREANYAVHSHTLGGVPLLDRILGLNVGPAPHYGSQTTVNVAHWAFRRPESDFPFTTTAGPSMRQVIDMGNTDGAGGFVIPTGQSGLPLSVHYDDQTPLWREGGLMRLPLDRSALAPLVEQRLTLDPADGNDR